MKLSKDFMSINTTHGGDSFLEQNRSLKALHAESLIMAGSHFLFVNTELTDFYAPKLIFKEYTTLYNHSNREALLKQ